MNNGKSKRKQGTRLAVPPRNFTKRCVLKRTVAGGVLRGRPDPPCICSSPWNNLVIATNVSLGSDKQGLVDLKLSSIATALKGQIGLGSVPLDIRIHRFDIWNIGQAVAIPNVTNFGFIAVAPYNLVTHSREQWIEDARGQNHLSHVHYQYPLESSQAVLGSNTDISVLSFDNRGSSLYLAHFHVLWRPTTADPLPTFRNEITGEAVVMAIR